MKTRIGRVRLRIRYKRRSDLVTLAALLALVLATAIFLGHLAWGSAEATTSSTQAPQAAFADMRKYYLTWPRFQGDETLTACASGYHMASLWEILDPSHLEYNTDLGYTQADGGAGPSPGYAGWARGWVRTGWDSEGITGIPGQDNCFAWTSDAETANGTVASLVIDWTSGSEDMHVWDVGFGSCSYSAPVWCVEDYVSSLVYLPLVLKNH